MRAYRQYTTHSKRIDTADCKTNVLDKAQDEFVETCRMKFLLLNRLRHLHNRCIPVQAFFHGR